ncbi:MAG: VPLPA-CTERM sorting domain-containing protein, partial [Alphaproteobacteria bacterium]|nr:VPLPA-CTERM sorting domain-containing protein [Alphaproteobacteria bacterium]
PAAANAALLAPPSEPPKTDIVLDGLAPRISFDASIQNDFQWQMAEPGIPTACRDGRAPFPARVAMRRCEVDHGGRERGDLRRSLAFAGDGVAVPIGGGLPVPVDTRALDPQVVPLPAGVWLLATALGGLAAVRRARKGRPAAATADA